MVLEYFSKPLLSFEWIYFRNSFCYRTIVIEQRPIKVFNVKFWAHRSLGGGGGGGPQFSVSVGFAEASQIF